MDKKELNINIKFIGIDIMSKSMVERPANFPVGIVEYNFEIKVESKVIADQKILMPVVTVKINELTTSERLAEIKAACLFSIENFDEIIAKKEDNGLYNIPVELEKLLRPVALSTTRGIIFSEFRGTYLANAIMPIIFMDTMKEEKSEALNA
ncbi:MAG: hypothetical protein Q8891_11700 [Bacteroidota bacterium]|nr:hypothetical protein [Bacteroidota bacterium]